MANKTVQSGKNASGLTDAEFQRAKRAIRNASRTQTDVIAPAGDDEVAPTPVTSVEGAAFIGPAETVVEEEVSSRYMWRSGPKALSGRSKPSETADRVRIIHREVMAVVRYHGEWAEVRIPDVQETFFVKREYLVKAK